MDVADDSDLHGISKPQAETGKVDDELEAARRFLLTHKAWNHDKASTEAAMLRAALPVLRQVESDLVRRAHEAETKELHVESGILGSRARALRVVLDAVEDGLDGHGWPSLTVGKAGQGFNLAQRRALAFGFAYIEAARAGKVRDPDPVRTVCEAYARRGKPLSPDSLSRWRRKYDLDTSYYDTFFVGDPKEVTAKAKEHLKRNSELVREGPARTKR